MFENLKIFLQPLGWFLALGRDDTKAMRSQIGDLLQHTTQSLRSLIELAQTLIPIERSAFNKNTFGPVYLHCQSYLTGPVDKVRTHCSDVCRDVQRINFVAAKILRTELSHDGWKGINTAFSELMDADVSFLNTFEAELKTIGNRLKVIFDKVVSPLCSPAQLNEAWNDYETLRTDLMRDYTELKVEIERLREAETHIRKVLT